MGRGGRGGQDCECGEDTGYCMVLALSSIHTTTGSPFELHVRSHHFSLQNPPMASHHT
jgi:hypothetical protein